MISGSMPHSGETPGGNLLPEASPGLFGTSRVPLVVDDDRVGTAAPPSPEPDAVVDNASDVGRFGERFDIPMFEEDPERA